jgi:hypothetical protein
MKKRTTNYQLDIAIKEQPVAVFNFFSDLQNQVYLHPLLTKVSEIKRFENEKGQEVTVFEIQERIKMLGFISLPNTYMAHRILLKEQNTCVFEVRSFPGIYLSSSYTFSEHGTNCTKVEEKVSIEAPFGLSGFVTKTAKQAHSTLLIKLKQYLEQKNGQLV